MEYNVSIVYIAKDKYVQNNNMGSCLYGYKVWSVVVRGERELCMSVSKC